VRGWAARFDASGDEEIERLASVIRRRGYLTRGDLLRICRWKSPRAIRRVEQNPPQLVCAATAAALSSRDARCAMESLLRLDGVGFPTASVILHFCHSDPYPILDFRALWSLGVEGSLHRGWNLWLSCTEAARRLARRARCSMRTLDRALWQFSKERQRARGKTAFSGGGARGI